MTKLIKTDFLINPKTKRRGARSTMYILSKEEKEAKTLFANGEKIFAITSSNEAFGISTYRRLLESVEEITEAYTSGLVCGVKMPQNKLLDEEYNVLNLLATRSGMDCWFWLVERGGKDMVRDLEADKYTVMSLNKALPIFAEGLLELNHYHLSEEEKEVVYQLFDRFGIDFKPV